MGWQLICQNGGFSGRMEVLTKLDIATKNISQDLKPNWLMKNTMSLQKIHAYLSCDMLLLHYIIIVDISIQK